MTTMASQITSLTIVYSTVYSGADQRKHKSSVSLGFVRGIHRGPVNFPHKWPVTRKMFPFDDVIMRHFYADDGLVLVWPVNRHLYSYNKLLNIYTFQTVWLARLKADMFDYIMLFTISVYNTLIPGIPFRTLKLYEMFSVISRFESYPAGAYTISNGTK